MQMKAKNNSGEDWGQQPTAFVLVRSGESLLLGDSKKNYTYFRYNFFF